MSNIVFEFQAPVGQRINRYGLGVTIMAGPNLWWSLHSRRWLTQEAAQDEGHGYTNTARCRTLKAFKRHIRKHAAALDGCEVCWVNRYVDHGVIARIGALKDLPNDH